MISQLILILSTLLPLIAGNIASTDATPSAGDECEKLGWFPEAFGLKDHSIFWYQGFYYLIANYVPGEDYFAYGRSEDLCNWEDLSPVLADRELSEWDQGAVWAPYVFEEEGVYYLFYTGVSAGVTQSVVLATSMDPADPASWQPQGMVFQPDHPGMVWEVGSWADCRDPYVLRVEDVYYLYYSGRDLDGGIVGMASAPSPMGAWKDWGSIIPALPNGVIPESSTLIQYDQTFYLFYNHAEQGEVVSLGGSQAGPWAAPMDFQPGWAHEVWQSPSGEWFTSYLTDYSVTIAPLTWDDFFSPPIPFIGLEVFHQLLPAVLHR
jgi:hypothetical protein